MPPDSMGTYIRECMHPHAASEHPLVHHHSFRHITRLHEEIEDIAADPEKVETIASKQAREKYMCGEAWLN